MQVDSVTVTDGVQIPEPSTFVLAAFGLLGSMGMLRRRKR
ncbi:MAG: PEP-CTERM sorting domain-containing protein [Planctomycetes bacterium]|nr:PEP-CTERM sorting domain-containing protein [Planctomycetota bacterium]